jgi:drug/metabolite transporter (DMT)-like permease
MPEKRNTLFGFIAILVWSTGAAFTRTLSEDLGAFSAAASVHLIAGVLAVLYQRFFANGANRVHPVPKAYWLTCGFFYVFYVTCSYLSVGLAQTRAQVIVIILIKFLWPLLTLVFTIPILRSKATPWLGLGALFSLAGIAVATLGSKVTDFEMFRESISGNITAYLLGLLSAVAWALYSNFSRKLAGNSEGGAGYFILITGIVLGAISFSFPEPHNFTGGVLGQLLYQAIFTSFIATLMWDAAMRRGNIVLVAIASNFLPLLTVTVSAFILGVVVGSPIWIGVMLVITGTTLSRRSFRTETISRFNNG